MRIGIYGGTFNPIHIGHLQTADTAMHKYGLDKVIFVPAGNPYMKEQSDIEPAFCRLYMTCIATSCIKEFEVSNIETKSDKPSYTADTLLYFKHLYPDDKLFLIVGEDAYKQMPQWKQPDISDEEMTEKGYKSKFEALADIIVVERDVNISSSKIREKLKHGESCRFLLPAGVYDYILSHKLYKDWETLERMTKGV